MVGKTLGKYRIIEKIGRGGMGVVYRAVDETLDRQVAIKVISPELVEDDLVRRFRAEAMTLAKVNHPNIATVFELFRDEDRLLMVMELVSGQTFERLVDRTAPMTVARAASLTGQILDALGHAHGAGIVHRDLKPANLMLTDAGLVKVMDFGIARVAGTERMTSDGYMVGTPAYMAPEQVRGEDVDGRTDLYAVGVVFYRLLTGTLPFKAETAVAMIQAQLNDQPTPARHVRADLPDWLDAVLVRSLAKRPADRYQTADQFRHALDSCGAPLPLPDDVTVATPAAPVAPRTAAVTEAAAVTPAAGPNPTTTLVLSRSHLAVAVVFGAMLLAVVGLLAWMALERQAPPVQVVTVPAPAPASAPPVAPATPSPAPRPVAPRPVEAAQPAALAPQTTAAPAGINTATPSVEPPAAPSAAEVRPFPERGRRGGPGSPYARGRSGSPSSTPTGAAGSQPVVFQNVHAMVPLRGGNRMVETTLTFDEKSMTVADTRSGFVVRTIAYDALQYAIASRSRLPRGAGGVELQVPGGFPAVVAKGEGPRTWVALRTADDRLVLRLDPPALRPVLELVGQRTKAKIERYMEP